MFLVRHLIGAISLVLLTANVIFWFIPILILAFLKLLLPIPLVRRGISFLLDQIASLWISINSFMAQFHCKVKVNWPQQNNFSTKNWYMVVANHQTWVDIYVLQKIFNRKIPFLKFFLKKELIYVPLLGIAWWALDFPFMKRHSKSYLKKNPHKKGQDLKTTQKACKKFKHIPISVMNFAEGTRFTAHKRERQNAPFEHLLKPKSGGIGTVLSILGEQMHTLVDVTIHYPHKIPTFWDFLCGNVGTIEVDVKTYEIDPLLIGDMTENTTRIKVQSWLNAIWQEKDALLAHRKA